MAGKLAYERYHWFHGRIKNGFYPNASSLAKEFEISEKQAQRDIEFMRDRLGAPLKYNAGKRGYEYEGSSYELPPVWFSGDELMMFCLASRLATTIPDSKSKRILRNFLEKFLSLRTIEGRFSIGEIEGLVSVKNIEYYRVKDGIFRAVMEGLLKKRVLKILYHSPHKNERTERVIMPLHLMCYMGSWHLIAYCSLRKEIRDFALSRIKEVIPSDERIAIPEGLPSPKEYMRKNFGVMAGKESKRIVLKFLPSISPWVSEQVWHEKQEATFDEDGSLHLEFPVSGYEEIVREILKYGSDVEVLFPDELRSKVKDEIKKMQMLYR